MAYILSQILGWIATFLRGGGMLAKKPDMIKYLVSGGNLLWAESGLLTGNIPLVVSNVVCLVIMGVDIIKNKKEKKNGPKASRTRN